MLFNRIEELRSRSFNMVGKTDPSCVINDDFPEDRLPLNERKFHEGVAVDMHQIERIEIDRNLFIGGSDVFRARKVNARLKEIEMRLSALVQSNDFAIKHRSIDRQSIKGLGQRRKTMNQ